MTLPERRTLPPEASSPEGDDATGELPCAPEPCVPVLGSGVAGSVVSDVSDGTEPARSFPPGRVPVDEQPASPRAIRAIQSNARLIRRQFRTLFFLRVKGAANGSIDWLVPAVIQCPHSNRVDGGIRWPHSTW